MICSAGVAEKRLRAAHYPVKLTPRATTSAVNGMRAAITCLPTATEVISSRLWQPRKAPSPEPDRQEAPSIPGSSVPEFKCGHSKIRRHVADHQYPWSSGGLSRRFTLVILRVQVSEHGEYTEMQWVYVASLAMTT
ncbi:hypothetical protein BJV74DRAFT_441299 [Russula compacta]|nr:hypothetical protein BJV74DRAFT_441299 [Russula compacta]